MDWIRNQLLRAMRVPPEPSPPMGAPGSVRVFRAGRNLYKLRLIGWGFGQLGGVLGIAFSLFLLGQFRHAVDEVRMSPDPAITVPAVNAPAATSASNQAPTGVPVPADQTTVNPATAPTSGKRGADAKRLRRENSMRRVARATGGWFILLLEVFEVGGILLFLAQIPVTLTALRLGYELQWYIVTDRSLRIRTGLVSLQEATMSFANLQQVEVQQGPLQRLLGLADVRVQSAGGGGDQPGKHGGDSLHTGVFQGVENADEIRDLILERLRQFRATGLGDPEEAASPAVNLPDAPARTGEALAAAKELLAEARALRGSLA